MEKEILDLTIPQKSILITEEYYSGTNINNITGYLLIDGKVDFLKLKLAINLFIKNNDAIRTRLIKVNNNFKQYISDYSEETIKEIFLENEEEFEIAVKKINKENFNILDKLYNFTIFNIGNNRGGVILSVHHLVCDAWSAKIVVDDLSRIYSKLLKDESLEITRGQYHKYIIKENEYLNSDKHKNDVEYWSKVFENSVNSDCDNSNSIKAKRITLKLDKEILNKSNEIDKSFFNIYLSALSIYEYKFKNRNDNVFGIPLLNRANYVDKNTFGMFVNTVPYRVKLNKNESFLSFINQNKLKEFELLRHQKLSYEEIAKIAKENGNDSNSLFDICVSYQNARDNHDNIDIVYKTGWCFNECISNPLDIHICDMDNTGTLEINYDYQMSKYSVDDIRKLHERIIFIIEQLINNRQVKISDISILKDEEIKQIKDFNSLKIDFNKKLTIIDLFNHQVKNNPNKIAINFEDSKITYEELDKESNKVANCLFKNKIPRGSIVGILLPKSLDYFISILGILKAGLVYMPMDIGFPDTRINYMFENSNSKYCICNEELENRIAEGIKIFTFNDFSTCNNIFDSNISSEDGCYIIYTSGTTGKPKGILVAHKNVVNYYYAFKNEYNLNENDIVLQQFAPTFDAFVEEFYPALFGGATIVSVSKATIYDSKKLEKIINDNNITLISCSPLLLKELNKMKIPKVKTFISGGDVLKKSYYSNLIKFANVYNTYGPTETTVCSTYHKCSGKEKINIPIGKTIANYENYIVNKDMQILPIGFEGELCIGGAGLSKGYINNKTLNEERFIVLPEINRLVFKTGDLCKYNKNGEIEFYERKDSQLKIRGYRVSLNEIEDAIIKYPGIEDCVVIDFENGDKKRLCAYYVGLNNITTKEIKEYLIKVLPSYMIPCNYIRLDQIPMNNNGKIDKNKLPNPLDIYLNRKIVLPRNNVDKKLISIWKKILAVKNLSIDDNLFELGADSLAIIEFISSAMENKWKINAQNIYECQSIRNISNKILDFDENMNDKVDLYKKINIYDLELVQSTKKINNILLTGATGFLGIHVLKEILDKTSYNVICMVRGNTNESSYERLKDTYFFYFKKNIEDYSERVRVFSGDIIDEKLGISDTEYDTLSKTIDTVIHTAALVKHYGSENVFRKINIEGTSNIISFCLNSESKLFYISTISVAGIYAKSDEEVEYNENSFWIDQNYNNNVYIGSKIEAEYLIFNAIKNKKLDARILRVGNLTGRSTDGVFQKNIQDNAFYNKIKEIINLEIIPNSLLNIMVDLTPIDLVSKAIVLLLHSKENNIVYHLYNNNLISVNEICKILNCNGYHVDIKQIKDNKDKNINQLTFDIYSGVEKNNIIVHNEYTQGILSKMGFVWNINIDEYFIKLVEYMKKINFLDGGNKS